MQYKKQKKAVNIIRIILHAHETTYAALNFTLNLCIKKLKILAYARLFLFFDPRLSENLAPHKLSFLC